MRSHKIFGKRILGRISASNGRDILLAISQGDIVEWECDVIVNASNEMLSGSQDRRNACASCSCFQNSNGPRLTVRCVLTQLALQRQAQRRHRNPRRRRQSFILYWHAQKFMLVDPPFTSSATRSRTAARIAPHRHGRKFRRSLPAGPSPHHKRLRPPPCRLRCARCGALLPRRWGGRRRGGERGGCGAARIGVPGGPAPGRWGRRPLRRCAPRPFP